MAERRSAGRRDRRGRREAIVRAAFELIGERGYGRTSLAAVAERVGLTQQGLLHYFPSKDELLVAVLEARDELDVSAGSLGPDRTAAGGSGGRGGPDDGGRAAEGNAPAADGAGAERRTTWDALALLVEINASRPGVVQTFTVLAGESVTDGHPARRYFTRRYAALRERLAASLGDAREAQLVIAVLDGLQIQWLLDPDAVDMGAAFDVFRSALDRARRADAG